MAWRGWRRWASTATAVHQGIPIERVFMQQADWPRRALITVLSAAGLLISSVGYCLSSPRLQSPPGYLDPADLDEVDGKPVDEEAKRDGSPSMNPWGIGVLSCATVMSFTAVFNRRSVKRLVLVANGEDPILRITTFTPFGRTTRTRDVAALSIAAHPAFRNAVEDPTKPLMFRATDRGNLYVVERGREEIWDQELLRAMMQGGKSLVQTAGLGETQQKPPPPPGDDPAAAPHSAKKNS